ncbi:Uncharacterized protein LW93_2934 [Fusarium fujikuroi]|uniref:Uncharacterized protein n=1 Tax=Fusarium fujikuroi TaxID=5127 RepID=A0A0I9XBS4_FUSFU|nr:Uncharacterized protein LW93_2934 [Fusarium fujikuroi]VTT79726.1 unnamed protein product [Fusarium fujikuroi]
MSAVASDKFFWLAYCKAVQQLIGNKPGKDSAIFFATKAQKGPPASALIPAEYTNNGLYQIGDNLLSADNMFYIPSAQNSYIRSLQNYLSYVDVEADQSEAVVTKYLMTQKVLNSAIEVAAAEQDKAVAQFEKNKNLGLTGDYTFAQWYPQHAPAYTNALLEVNAAAGENKAAIGDMNGPVAAQYSQDRDKITQALTSLTAVPGIAMGACADSPATAVEIAQNKGQVPPPKSVRYVPTYMSADYTKTVKDWMNQLSHGKPGKNIQSIKMSNGRNVDESEFGQETLEGDLSFSYAPWLSFAASGSSDHESQLDKTDINENDIEIAMTYDDIKTVPISPGDWNIGDPKSSYPKLKEGAPITAKILVAPTQLVLAKNLGYTIKFKNNLKTTFGKTVKDTKQVGGYVRIFGIPISVDGNYKKSSQQTSHVATWDETSGEFVVVPTDDGGFATVIAIQGDKIHTI